MLLAIDVGNTNTVLGVFDQARLVSSWRVRTEARATADELAWLWSGLLGEQHLTGIAACSTVPALVHEIRQVCARYYPHLPTVVVEPGVSTGVPLLYDNPREVGPDRIANSLAAYHLYGGPAVVVDFGTSTNFDVVSARGEFLGGALAPGIEISVDALAQRGARLFKVEVARPRSVIGKSTVEALQSGLLYGFAGQVDGIVERIAAEIGPLVVVVATGGLAPLVVSESRTITAHEPDLTLVGLRLVFERHHPTSADILDP
ncbi:MAG: type III pantothenate kinase [Actinomycetes bacterium]